MASFTPARASTGERDNIGGWHDAGDYGRYMVTTGISAGTLLWTWEIYGKKIENISLRIPESGNGTPDILNEARWGLEWMLKMQDDGWRRMAEADQRGLSRLYCSGGGYRAQQGDRHWHGAIQEHLRDRGPGGGGGYRGAGLPAL